MNQPVARTAALILLLALPFTAHADPILTVSRQWIREAPPNARVMAGYMTLINSGNQPAVVTKISSPDFATIEIHRTVMETGIARMLPVKQIRIPANSNVALKPGGMHLMLFDPQQSLREGATVELVFHCGLSNCATASAPVKRATGEPDHTHHH